MAQELIQKVDDKQSTEYLSQVLRKRTAILNILSYVILICLIISIILIVLYVTDPFTYFSRLDRVSTRRTILYFGYTSLFTGTFILFAFSNLRKRSYAYYEALAEELEWGTDNYKSKTTPIEYKIAIREFLKSSDLPFADSSKLGQLIYLILFIGLIIALAYFSNTIK